MVDDLTKALLLEEVATPHAVAEALFTSITGGAPLVQSLVETGATSSDILARYLARGEAPFLRQVAPVPELMARLPPGLCARLFAIPVRHDAITGTIDVVVADASDLHPANEIGFHLGAPVRLVRAAPAAIDEALRRMRNDGIRRDHTAAVSSRAPASLAPSARGEPARNEPARNEPARNEPAAPPRGSVPPDRRDTPVASDDDERLYDSRPRPYSTVPQSTRAALLIQPDSIPPPPDAPPVRIRTPPWGTPVHSRTEPPPPSGYGSEIPLPLTRKTFYPAKAVRGGTQRPAGLVDPTLSPLGEGYAFDATGLRDLVERAPARIDDLGPSLSLPSNAGSVLPPLGSFIPGPPPIPTSMAPVTSSAPQIAAEMSGVVAALKNAGSRDEVLELVLTGSRIVAIKVALFVVKKGGYLGWMCTPEFADRSQLQTVLVPLEDNSVFDRAIREDIYLGPIRYDDVHAPLLRILKNPTRDVAVVPIRVSGRTAVVIVADELGDTMIGTRRLEELARAAGDAFGRIVRTKR